MQDIDDLYVVEGELGRGGFARVWAARERATDRAVVIKEPLDGAPAAFAALAREVRIHARLDHPGIVRVLASGTWRDGTPYAVLPRLAGRTLFEALRRARTPAARRALVPAVLAVCDAMAHAHARGVVHRDLTPANIIVGDDGRVTVVDWGLAVAPGAGGDDHASAGTFPYLAPEQLRGRSVGPRADVYALGVLLGEVLGESLDDDDDDDDDGGGGAIDRALGRVAARASAFDAAARPRDAAALARALRRARRATRGGARESHAACIEPVPWPS